MRTCLSAASLPTSAAQGAPGQLCKIGLHHPADERQQVPLGRPVQHLLGPGGITDQLGRLLSAQQPTVMTQIRTPIQADHREGRLDELLHRVQPAGSKDIIARCFVPQGQPHAPHVIPGIAPVALRRGVPQRQVILLTQFDRRRGPADFARDEVFAAAGGFVIVEESVHQKEAVFLPLDPHHLRGERLGGP